jgi:hypothetical protein
MNTYAITTSRVPLHLAAAAAVVAGTVGALAGAAIARDDNRPAPAVEEVVTPRADVASSPVYLEVLEQARLRDAVDRMPAGWPATEVMRHQVEAPLGDAAQRARWREAAEHMPAGWPATEATRRSGAEPSD